MDKKDILKELKELVNLLKDEFEDIDDEHLMLIAEDIYRETHDK